MCEARAGKGAMQISPGPACRTHRRIARKSVLGSAVSKHELPQQVRHATTREGVLPQYGCLRQAWLSWMMRVGGPCGCIGGGPAKRAHAYTHSDKEGYRKAGRTPPASGALEAGRERLVRALRRVRSDRQPSLCPPPALSAPGTPFALCCGGQTSCVPNMFATGPLILSSIK